jgi:hypothetical protein
MFSRSVATAAFFGALFLASSLSTAYAANIRGLVGKCLTVSGANSTNGTPIILFDCIGRFNQKWIVD